MDCSKTSVFLKERARMHGYYVEKEKCSECPLEREKNGFNKWCNNMLLDLPEEAIKIVQKWSDEHPREIDWAKVPVDTPVIVWDTYRGDKKARYFAMYMPAAEFKYKVFDYGDKWTEASSISGYLHCELAPEVDPTPYYKE